MFRILDGRSFFYQWDKDQQLEVMDYDITEVHFSTQVSEKSLVCEVKEQEGKRVVDVPNILLQETWDIKVYACCDCYTRGATIYEVKPKEKPEDYIYTETEVKTFADLEARIEELEKNGGGTGGGGAVASVNGKTGAVILTASDVGALSTSGGTINGVLNLGNTANTTASTINVRKKISDTQYMTGSITASGSDFKIQNSVSTKRSGSTTQYTTATNSILIGDNDTSVSKPILFTTTAAKEDTRDSLSVYSKAEVDALIPEETDLSGYYTKQETDAAILSAIGGDNERFELIENIVLEEETAAIERNKEPNGKAYDFKEMIIYILNEAYEKQGNNLTWQMIFNGDGSGIIPWIVCQASNYQQHLAAYVKIHKGRCFYDTAASINGMSNTNVAMNQSANSKGLCEADNLRQFRLSVYQNTMRAGTIIKIYGVRNNA